MFGFMKKHTDKDRDDKKRREKREKKDRKKFEKHLTADELSRLEEARRGLWRRLSDTKPPANGRQVAAMSVSSGSGVSAETGSTALPDDGSANLTFTSYRKMELSSVSSAAPQANQMTTEQKKGILKDKSHYGPAIPNQGVRGKLDDSVTVQENTQANEVYSTANDVVDHPQQEGNQSQQEGVEKSVQPKRSVRSMIADMNNADSEVMSVRKTVPLRPQPGSTANRHPVIPPKPRIVPPPAAMPPEISLPDEPVVPSAPSSPVDKTYPQASLRLPVLSAPCCPPPRDITLQRQAAGDFGFTLRRGVVLERDTVGEHCRAVIFAEPGPRGTSTGLLPGDRLIAVNGTCVRTSSRDDVIEIIKRSVDNVSLRVQPIPELSELSASLVSTDHQNQAKSEAELAADKDWMSTERLWLVHKDGFAAVHRVDGTEASDGKCQVQPDDGGGGDVLQVDEGDVQKANPPQFDRAADLADLRYLNEASLLHTLRQRYASNLIHTYAGNSLLIVNPMHSLSIYTEKVMQMYRTGERRHLPPHIYATAQAAHRSMLATKHDQALVFLGRSGSGKTSNLKQALHYLTVTTASNSSILTVNKLNAIFMLLDAFGSTKTLMNTSATKFTSIFGLDYDQAGQITSASIQVMMLEKSHIVRRTNGEPTFHIFYQLLAGIDSQLRKELLLENLADTNIFMTPLQRPEDRQHAVQVWAKICQSMEMLSIKPDDTNAISAVLAAIYHLGVASCVKGQNNKYQFARPEAAQRAATVLGTTIEKLARHIFQPSQQLQSKPSFRGTLEKANSSDTVSGLEALEGFVIGLYSEAFHALVALINRAITSSTRSVNSLLLLDIPGLQSSKLVDPSWTGGCSFEELGQNYAHERLQQLFHESVFTAQQDFYAQEDIECNFEISSPGPAPVVDLIDKPNLQTRANSLENNDTHGLLWLLEEEAIVGGGTDKSFTDRLLQVHGQDKYEGSHNAGLLLKKAASGFVLRHLQGSSAVQYNTTGWLKVCRENPVMAMTNAFLQESSRHELRELFSKVRGSSLAVGMTSGSLSSVDSTSSTLRRTSSMRRTAGSPSASIKRKSVCLQLKFQVDSIVETIRRTRVHFVHCLLPQHNAGLCDVRHSVVPKNPVTSLHDNIMDVPLVRAQVRAAEILDSVRIYRQGFPEHMPFSEYCQRFRLLLPEDSATQNTDLDDKQRVVQMLEHMELDPATYRLGRSQVFFRAGGVSSQEAERQQKVAGVLLHLQAACRGYLARRSFEKLKLQQVAVKCVQRNVRKFMAIRDWQWWKLYMKIEPLLNVHRTEEELQSREAELEQLKLKYEKAEKERTELKQTVDKLECKLSDVTADLSDVHTTSSHVSEMLESETVDRLNLQRDLKDITSKYNALQRKQQQTEMELMQTRMMLSSLDEELDEDDVDGDSVYRERYERSRREAEFAKKRLIQQHEEEMEQLEMAKKQLDRKYLQATEETSEVQRQLANTKRKSQNTMQQMQDIKLHLEEQIGRNSELEKKQRRFDSELSKLNELLKEEKMHREKMQHEKEEIAAEKYSFEQEVKNLKLDRDMQNEKIDSLERELHELSSHGNKDDKEMVHLKRLKNELDRKLVDQEEELDEQAGTIQQLEQSKLRLEMAQEKLRQQLTKEMDEKEQEMEEMRASTLKKLKHMELQLEDEYEEKQAIQKEKRELERKLQELAQAKPTRDRGVEKRLRKDLKRTKTMLHDAQLMLDKQSDAVGNKSTIKQLRNQLEDAEFNAAAALKARRGLEQETAELQQQLDDVSRVRQEAEARCTTLSRQCNDLQSQLAENEEDLNDIMKKYKAAVQQQNVDQITILDQSKQIEEMQQERQVLKEQLAQIQSSTAFQQDSCVDKQLVLRLEAKIREYESRVEFEQTSRQRAEVQLSRLKEQMERAAEERERREGDEQRTEEEVRRLQRQLKEMMAEQVELQRAQMDATQHASDADLKVQSLQSDYEQSQTDLRLAFKRIADLQAVIDIGSDDDDDDSDQLYSAEDSGASDEDDSESELDLDVYMASSRSKLPSTTRRRQDFMSESSTESSLPLSRNRSTDLTDSSTIVSSACTVAPAAAASAAGAPDS